MEVPVIRRALSQQMIVLLQILNEEVILETNNRKIIINGSLCVLTDFHNTQAEDARQRNYFKKKYEYLGSKFPY